MNVSNRDVEKIGLRLLLAHPAEQAVVKQWFEREPATAAKAIRETARVLMLAKSIKPSAGDALFYQNCAELVALSFVNPEIRQFFNVVSEIDLEAFQSDRMIATDMLNLTRERVGEIVRCLG